MKKKDFEWHTIEEKKPSIPQLQKNNLLRNKKYSFPLLLALLSTIIQVIFLKSCSYLSNKNNSTKSTVVITSKNIPQGGALSKENTKLAYLDLGESKNTFVLNSEFQKYLDHKTRVNIDENTPILKTIIMDNFHEKSLPEKIPHGKRFYVIDADLSSLSSMIMVGDRVDIIAHMDINGFGKAIETILTGIKIIGIGDVFEENSSNPNANTLSFYLTPEEVKIISFMKPYSQFTVAIRNPTDLGVSDSGSITFNKFIQNEKIQKIFKNDYFKIIEGNSIKNSNIPLHK